MFQGSANETIEVLTHKGAINSSTYTSERIIHQIEGYMVYIVDKWRAPITNISFVSAKGLSRTCCDAEAYSTRIRHSLPSGSRYFMIVAYTKDWGPLPAGTYVEIEDLTPTGIANADPCSDWEDFRMEAAKQQEDKPGTCPSVVLDMREAVHPDAELTFPICVATTTTATTVTTTSATTFTTVTTTTQTTLSPLTCTCPLNTFNVLYGPVTEAHSLNGSCCNMLPGSTCQAFTSNYRAHPNPCILDGSIEFMCPCGSVNGVAPYLITPNVGCEACASYLNFSEADWTAGRYLGSLTFGPNMVGGIVNEEGIEGYRIHVTDGAGLILGDNISFVESQGIVKNCCVVETYVLWLDVAIPAQAVSFLIAPWSSLWGTQPSGTFLDIPLSLTPPPTAPPAKESSSVSASLVAVVVVALLLIEVPLQSLARHI
jgi:hypothetical protein